MSTKHDQESKVREHIDKLLAEAPPLTGRQRSVLAELLAPVRGGGSRYVPLPPPLPSERELRRAELTEQARSIAAEVQACAICGVPIFVHNKWGHPWEPSASAIARHSPGELGRDRGSK